MHGITHPCRNIQPSTSQLPHLEHPKGDAHDPGLHDPSLHGLSKGLAIVFLHAALLKVWKQV